MNNFEEFNIQLDDEITNCKKEIREKFDTLCTPVDYDFQLEFCHVLSQNTVFKLEPVLSEFVYNELNNFITEMKYIKNQITIFDLIGMS